MPPTPCQINEFERTQVLVSERFSGFFLIPGPDGIWNYAFQSINHSKSLKYSLQADNPPEFYAECHRPAHFLQFNGIQSVEDESMATDEDGEGIRKMMAGINLNSVEGTENYLI